MNYIISFFSVIPDPQALPNMRKQFPETTRSVIGENLKNRFLSFRFSKGHRSVCSCFPGNALDTNENSTLWTSQNLLPSAFTHISNGLSIICSSLPNYTHKPWSNHARGAFSWSTACHFGLADPWGHRGLGGSMARGRIFSWSSRCIKKFITKLHPQSMEPSCPWWLHGLF